MNEDQRSVAAIMEMVRAGTKDYQIEHQLFLALHNAFLRGMQHAMNVGTGPKIEHFEIINMPFKG